MTWVVGWVVVVVVVDDGRIDGNSEELEGCSDGRLVRVGMGV